MDMINRFAGLKKYGVKCPLDIYLSVISVLKKYQTCLLISDKDTNLIYVGKCCTVGTSVTNGTPAIK